jgi:hypothetical protein
VQRKKVLLICGILAFLGIAAAPFIIVGYVRTFDTISEMVLNADPRDSTHKSIRVSGYWTKGDKGGGNFYAVNNTTSTNTGTKIASSLAGWSWIRIQNGQLTPNMFGALGNDSTADEGSISNTISAGGDNSTITFNPKTTYKVGASVFVSGYNGLTLDGKGATLHNVGNFRTLYVTNSSNIKIKNFYFSHSSGGGSQCPIFLTNCFNVQIDNIYIDQPALNGVEVYSSTNVVVRSVYVEKPAVFGLFSINSDDVTWEDCTVHNAGSFSMEPKSSKRVKFIRCKIFSDANGGAQQLWTSWTGFSTGPEIPGTRLNEDISLIDCVIKGGPNSHAMIDINATRNINIKGGMINQDPDAAWGNISMAGNFFYNEGSTMTGNTTSGSTNITSVVDPDGQIVLGSRIHVADIVGQDEIYMVTSKSGTSPNITLGVNFPVTATVTGKQIGFAAIISDITIDGLHITGGGDSSDSIDIGGTSRALIERVTLRNLTIDSAARYALYLHNVKNIFIENSAILTPRGLVGMYVDENTDVTVLNSIFTGKTNTASYGIVMNSNSRLTSISTEYRDLGIGGIVTALNATNTSVRVIGGLFINNATAPILVTSDSLIENAIFTNNLVTLGSFNGDIRIEGTNNLVANNLFYDSGVWHDSFIKEQSTNATDNIIAFNRFSPSLANNVILSSGSTSSRFSPDITAKTLVVNTITDKGAFTADNIVSTNKVKIGPVIADLGYRLNIQQDQNSLANLIGVQNNTAGGAANIEVLSDSSAGGLRAWSSTFSSGFLQDKFGLRLESTASALVLAADSVNTQTIDFYAGSSSRSAYLTNGDLILPLTGGGVSIKEGSNAKMGTSALTAGTATVATTAVTTNSRIFLTVDLPGGTVGSPYVSTRTNLTSFVITSTSGTDTSTVSWIIVEPAP